MAQTGYFLNPSLTHIREKSDESAKHTADVQAKESTPPSPMSSTNAADRDRRSWKTKNGATWSNTTNDAATPHSPACTPNSSKSDFPALRECLDRESDENVKAFESSLLLSPDSVAPVQLSTCGADIQTLRRPSVSKFFREVDSPPSTPTSPSLSSSSLSYDVSTSQLEPLSAGRLRELGIGPPPLQLNDLSSFNVIDAHKQKGGTAATRKEEKREVKAKPKDAVSDEAKDQPAFASPHEPAYRSSGVVARRDTLSIEKSKEKGMRSRQSRFLLAALLENFTIMFDQSPDRNGRLYRVLCDRLCQAGLLEEEHIEEMSGLRRTYNRAFRDLVARSTWEVDQQDNAPISKMLSFPIAAIESSAEPSEESKSRCVPLSDEDSSDSSYRPSSSSLTSNGEESSLRPRRQPLRRAKTSPIGLTPQVTSGIPHSTLATKRPSFSNFDSMGVPLPVPQSGITLAPGIFSGTVNPLFLDVTDSRYNSDFEELGILGKGGFGSVVAARNRLDGANYAVKKIRVGQFGDEDDMNYGKLFREIKSLARLEHVNIVRYYSSWIEHVPVTHVDTFLDESSADKKQKWWEPGSGDPSDGNPLEETEEVATKDDIRGDDSSNHGDDISFRLSPKFTPPAPEARDATLFRMDEIFRPKQEHPEKQTDDVEDESSRNNLSDDISADEDQVSDLSVLDVPAPKLAGFGHNRRASMSKVNARPPVPPQDRFRHRKRLSESSIPIPIPLPSPGGNTSRVRLVSKGSGQNSRSMMPGLGSSHESTHTGSSTASHHTQTPQSWNTFEEGNSPTQTVSVASTTSSLECSTGTSSPLYANSCPGNVDHPLLTDLVLFIQMQLYHANLREWIRSRNRKVLNCVQNVKRTLSGGCGSPHIFSVAELNVDEIHRLCDCNTPCPGISSNDGVDSNERKQLSKLHRPHKKDSNHVQHIRDLTQNVLTHISSDNVLALFIGIVEGVAHLHAMGHIHRDLKPANVFLERVADTLGAVNGSSRTSPFVPSVPLRHVAGDVTTDDASKTLKINKDLLLKEAMWIPKIGDFGLSTTRTTESPMPSPSTTISPTGARTIEEDIAPSAVGGERTRGIGTMTYASPEMVHGDVYDEKVDMYALGIILFELLYPFSTGMERARLLDHLRTNKELPENFIKHWPVEAALILKLTSNEPRDRPSAKETLQQCKLIVQRSRMSSANNNRSSNQPAAALCGSPARKSENCPDRYPIPRFESGNKLVRSSQTSDRADTRSNLPKTQPNQSNHGTTYLPPSSASRDCGSSAEPPGLRGRKTQLKSGPSARSSTLPLTLAPSSSAVDSKTAKLKSTDPSLRISSQQATPSSHHDRHFDRNHQHQHHRHQHHHAPSPPASRLRQDPNRQTHHWKSPYTDPPLPRSPSSFIGHSPTGEQNQSSLYHRDVGTDAFDPCDDPACACACHHRQRQIPSPSPTSVSTKMKALMPFTTFPSHRTSLPENDTWKSRAASLIDDGVSTSASATLERRHDVYRVGQDADDGDDEEVLVDMDDYSDVDDGGGDALRQPPHQQRQETIVEHLRELLRVRDDRIEDLNRRNRNLERRLRESKDSSNL